MTWSTESKVGAFTLVGIVIFATVMIQLGSLVFFGPGGFRVTGYFKEAEGLEPGNPVRYAGVAVGMVDKVSVENGQAVAILRLYDNVKIPQNASFSIQTTSVMGGRFIRVADGDAAMGYLEDGMVVYGMSGRGIDGTVAKVDALIVSAQAMLDGINSVVADPNAQQSVRSTIANLDEVSRNLSVLTEQGIDVAHEMQGIASQMNGMLQELNHDGKVTTNTRKILDNLVIASENAKKISGDAENISRQINGIMTGQDLAFEGELLYNTNTERLSPRVDLRVGDKRYARFGAESLGEGTKYNFQIGKKDDDWDFYTGIIRSKLGVGTTYERNRWQFSAELFDLNDATVRLRSSYQFRPHVFATVQSIFPHNRDGGGEYAGIGFAY